MAEPQAIRPPRLQLLPMYFSGKKVDQIKIKARQELLEKQPQENKGKDWSRKMSSRQAKSKEQRGTDVQ